MQRYFQKRNIVCITYGSLSEELLARLLARLVLARCHGFAAHGVNRQSILEHEQTNKLLLFEIFCCHLPVNHEFRGKMTN